MGVSVGRVLRDAARRHPDRVALVEPRREGPRHTTYGALDRSARVAAASLRRAGVPPGGRLALFAENGRAFVEAWFGATYAGCTVVPVPILSAAPELAFRLSHARCDAVVTDETRAGLAEKACDASGEPARILDVRSLAAGADPIDHPMDADPDAAAMILYTSGTTGKPKGAVITHASLTAHTTALVRHTLRLDQTDSVLGVLPLTHSYGIRMVILATFLAGGRAVLLPRFGSSDVLETLVTERITWLPVVPTMLAALAASPPPAGEPAALRWCLSAGSPLAEDVRRRAEERLGVTVRQGYGLTEATFSTIDAPPHPAAPGSVGRPVWGIEVRVVDERDRDVPPGEQGQILVRGQNLMRGYLDDDDATGEVLRGGFLHTGDIGRLDGEGRLAVVDRIKDMIIRGGHNVYPSEVEDVLSHHPAIAEVAVIGRPDDHWGEEVVAVIVLRDGVRVGDHELDRFARESLASTKVPREVCFVGALPLGPSRKILKRELRAMLADGRLRATPLGPRGG